MYLIVETKDVDVSKINDVSDAGGRFGNQFIRNIVCEHFAKKNNLKFKYGETEKMEKLGIHLFSGTETYEETLIITDDIIDSLFNEGIFDTYAKNKNFLFWQHNYNANHIPHSWKSHLAPAWVQTPITAKFVANYIREYDAPPKKDALFVHVRQGDIINTAVSFEYYDKAISQCSFKEGYIASDTITSSTCMRLIQKYNLKVCEKSDIDTILFGITFNQHVLSGGTYSWLIGVLAQDSHVFYPTEKHNWRGNIFVFPEWTELHW